MSKEVLVSIWLESGESRLVFVPEEIGNHNGPAYITQVEEGRITNRWLYAIRSNLMLNRVRQAICRLFRRDVRKNGFAAESNCGNGVKAPGAVLIDNGDGNEVAGFHGEGSKTSGHESSTTISPAHGLEPEANSGSAAERSLNTVGGGLAGGAR